MTKRSTRHNVKNRAEQEYFEFPKLLLLGEFYKNTLNANDRQAYVVLLNRLKVSIKNNWIDDKGDIYFLYSIKNLSTILNINKNTVKSAKKKLKETGLLEEVEIEGQTSRLYLTRPVPANDEEAKYIITYDDDIQETEDLPEERKERISESMKGNQNAKKTEGGQKLTPSFEKAQQQGSSNTEKQKGVKNSPRGGQKLTPSKKNLISPKDFKENQDSYSFEDDLFQQANDRLADDPGHDTQLISTLIQREGIEDRFGSYIVQNMRHYAKGDFTVFRLLWEKLKYAHIEAEKVVGDIVSVNDYWVSDSEHYERQLSTTFWHVCEMNKQGQIKTSFKGYLFLSLKNVFLSIHSQQQDGKPVSLSNWLEQ